MISYESLAKGARLFGLIWAISAAFCTGSASQPRELGVRPSATVQMASPAAESVPRVSKFEARHIRRACRDEAAKPGTQAPQKNMSHCFQMHVLARRFARECKSAGEVKGLNGSARENAMQSCVSEKMRNVVLQIRKAQDP